MVDSTLSVRNPPIIEAIVDIDCDFPPGTTIASLEAPARDAFRDHYPLERAVCYEFLRIGTAPDALPGSGVDRGKAGLQFLQEDQKQIVQVRSQGFAFNRLAPYASLDDYFPEIQRCWELFVRLAEPLQVRGVRLRYINRIFLPLGDVETEVTKYFRVAPRSLDEERLELVGFFQQLSAVDKQTGFLTNTVLTTQGFEGDKIVLILDNQVEARNVEASLEWSWILKTIQELRTLKNRIFEGSITDACLLLLNPK